MAELRSFIFLSRLQPQTMCYLGTWIRGSLPRSHVAAQVIEVAPGLDIEPLTDVAVKHADVRAGILVVERQFGYLEIHGGMDEVRAAGTAVLESLGASAPVATRPSRSATSPGSPHGRLRPAIKGLEGPSRRTRWRPTSGATARRPQAAAGRRTARPVRNSMDRTPRRSVNRSAG